MAVVWIVTTGNSDVKLTSDEQWGYLREQKREALKPCYKDFKSPVEDSDGLFLLPARVMGTVYGDALDGHWKYFQFPLLSEFTSKIKTDKRNRPDRIMVLLTNQDKIFLENNPVDSRYDRSDPDCPFWKDTCKLEPILQHYFDENFGPGKAEFCPLEPELSSKGLDNWDATLSLVQQRFEQWNISKTDRVIVSHQAGTPAISSAVQLTALIKFGKKVQFLVSNEFIKGQVEILPGSSYFRTLQIQEAQQSLKRFDYAGIKRALDKIEISESERLTHLIELAELWNAAKFGEFADRLGDSVAARSNKWWWKGYEMAYLAWIRMFQENPTEAFFHSVRAVEGLICEWAIKNHSGHVHYKFVKTNDRGEKNVVFLSQRFRNGQEGSPVAKNTIDSKFREKLYDNQKEALRHSKLGLHGQTLYLLFRTTYESSLNIESHPISIVWQQLADERNELFHRLQGLTEAEVYQAWGCTNRERWGQLLFDCIRLVSGTEHQGFNSLKQGSLMTEVHQALENELNNLL